MANIHPSAVIDSGVELGQDVHVGPLCVVQRGAVIGDRCRLASHVVVHGRVKIGDNNQIHEGAVLGGQPQHLQAGPEVGRVRIGNGNIIREHVTIHCSLQPDTETVIGDHNLLMVNAHVAHDCQIANHAILVNNVMLGGHVTVEDRAYLSGGVGVHQFCRVGSLAMVSGLGRVTQDLPPYVMFDGRSKNVTGLNVIGLRRNGYTADEIQQLKSAYRVIYRSGLSFPVILETLAAQFPDGPAARFREFLAAGNSRGYVGARASARRPTLPLVASQSGHGRSPRRLGRAA